MKTDDTKGTYSVRDVRLSVRISQADKDDLQELRKLLSPHAELSEGKAISVAIRLAKVSLARTRARGATSD
jgi:hypothetical protein